MGEARDRWRVMGLGRWFANAATLAFLHSTLLHAHTLVILASPYLDITRLHKRTHGAIRARLSERSARANMSETLYRTVIIIPPAPHSPTRYARVSLCHTDTAFGASALARSTHTTQLPHRHYTDATHLHRLDA